MASILTSLVGLALKPTCLYWTMRSAGVLEGKCGPIFKRGKIIFYRRYRSPFGSSEFRISKSTSHAIIKYYLLYVN